MAKTQQFYASFLTLISANLNLKLKSVFCKHPKYLKTVGECPSKVLEFYIVLACMNPVKELFSVEIL